MKILSEQQEAEFFTSISGKGEVPLKFDYITPEGSQGWIDTVNTERAIKSDTVASSEYTLLEENSLFFFSKFGEAKGVNIIDLGCGDGTAAVPIIERALKEKKKVRYVPVDISKGLLDAASKTVEQKFLKIEIKKVLLDFDLGGFPQLNAELRANGYVNLMCFLGSTLGNFSNTERLLSNFRDSMSSKDYLIIGIQLANLLKIEKMLEFYRSEPVRKLTFSLLKAYGVTREIGKFDLTFNEKLSQVESRFTLNKEYKLKIGNEMVSLEKGEALLLFRSIKFGQWNLQKLMSDVGFRIDTVKTNDNASYEIIMCQPLRYLV